MHSGGGLANPFSLKSIFVELSLYMGSGVQTQVVRLLGLYSMLLYPSNHLTGLFSLFLFP